MLNSIHAMSTAEDIRSPKMETCHLHSPILSTFMASTQAKGWHADCICPNLVHKLRLSLPPAPLACLPILAYRISYYHTDQGLSSLKAV